jgi:F0F1-type ATP synthase membrane subunit b/b'
VVTGFWFASIASHGRKDAVAKVREEYARERESLRVDAEREKSLLVKESQERITKQTNRAHAKANFKVGAAFAAIMGAGVLMIFTQFLSLGLLTLATGGGALAGYLARLKQELTGLKKNQPPLIIQAEDTARQLPIILEDERQA